MMHCRSLLWMVALVALVVHVGCIRTPPPARTTSATAPAPADPPFDVTKLDFATPELRQRFEHLLAAAAEFNQKDYGHQPLAQMGRGNNVWAVWTEGFEFNNPDRPKKGIDTHHIRVATSMVPPPTAEFIPKSKLASLFVERISADPDQWCVHWYYCEDIPEGATGQTSSISFFRWDPAKRDVIPFRALMHARELVRVPLTSHRVADSEVQLPKRGAKDHFLRYARSADALRDAYLEDLTRLEMRVAELINAHKAKKKVYGEAKGGRPPQVLRMDPLSKAEEQTQMAMAKEHFAAQAKLMRDHHREMYAALRRSFPIERGWPELAEDKAK